MVSSANSINRLSVAAAALLWLSGCAVAGGQAGAPAVLTPTVLTGAPDQYNGREVVVKGYLVIEPELNGLYESHRFLKEWDAKSSDDPTLDWNVYARHCLSVENRAFVGGRWPHAAGHDVIVHGRFDKFDPQPGELGLGGCSLTAGILIDKVEVLPWWR